MAKSARGNSNYGVKPSSYFYASVEVYLSTFQIVEWYGYGKASADSPMYYAGQYSGNLSVGAEIYANMIGTRTLVTSPAFWKFERSVGTSNDIAISRQEVNAYYLEHGGTTLNWIGAGMASIGSSFTNFLLGRNTSAVDTQAGVGSVAAAPTQVNNQAAPPPAPPPNPAATTTMAAAIAAATAVATAAAIAVASQVLVTSAIRGAEETDNSRTRRQGEKEAAAAEEEAEEENGDE